MELINTTPFPAGFFNTVVTETGLLGAVVCKPTWRLDGANLVPDDENPWPVTNEPIETECGEFDGELPFIRRGVDFIYAGSIYAPRGNPVQALDVEIAVGQRFRRRIRAFGNRRWDKTWRKLKPTEPELFKVLPLTYANAFGGKCEVESGEMEWSANPQGKGYYVEQWQAENNVLPNLEDPEHLIETWDDRPDPVGTAPYPVKWALRALNAIEMDESDPARPRIKRILPTYFNNAHPQMIITDPIVPGDQVRISHASPDGPLSFALPNLNLHAHVQLETRQFVFPMHLEQISVLGNERRVFFSYRACFHYDVIPTERRVVTIHEGPAPASVPGSYIHDLDSLEQFA